MQKKENKDYLHVKVMPSDAKTIPFAADPHYTAMENSNSDIREQKQIT